MPDESLLINDTIPKATAEQRQRGKSMSRRSGQAGTIVKEGGWYRVRFRLDVPGQYQRVQRSIKICPVSGPGLLTKPERERRKVEIVNSFGANSLERFRNVVEGESGVTFREQSNVWLKQMKTRKRKPVKPATVINWEMALNKWLLPLIGDFSLANVKNGTLKMLVSRLDEAGLSPSSIRTYCRVMTMVVGSLKDDDANPIYPRKWDYEFADAPEIGLQRRPSFTGEELTKLIARVKAREQMVLILFAASGLRAGELFGLEVRHFLGNAVQVQQSVWSGDIQTPKTKSAYRIVELHSSVAAMLRNFIGERKEGFIFAARNGSSLRQSNFLRRALHPILKALGIEKQGLHGLRRYRVTHLESSSVPQALIDYWTGHAKKSDGENIPKTMNQIYTKMDKDAAFRQEVAERIGIGFELPKPVVPGVPRNVVGIEL
jgi:integrase